MAGPLTIQRYPRGLLDLLGSKSSGDNPTELAPTVAGIIDLGYMYQFDKVEGRTATTNVVNLNGAWGVTGPTLVVPAGEVWLLHNASANANANLAAGESYTINVAIYRSQWSQWQLSPNQGSGSGITARPAVGWQFDRPELLRPSDTFGIYCSNITAGATQFTVSAYITRLTI